MVIMKKYVLVGTGSRGTQAYLVPISKDFKENGKIVGVYDTSRKRAEAAVKITGCDIPVFDDFDKMLEVTKPDYVIVTVPDCEHDEYIVRSLKLGCDVISEKPLSTTPEKFRRICEAEKNSGKGVTTTFNCRYMNHFEKIKEIIQSGEIGKVFSVHYEWLLDRDHGASYFRRWHRERKNSGSLLIHKSTHHFDLLNWFLEDEPEEVNAFGNNFVYGKSENMKNVRCLGCPEKDSCEFFYDVTKDPLDKALYYECEEDSGYIRDKCLFSDEIDIEDTVSVNIKYKKGTVVSYSLTAHSPYEGAKIVFNGSLGRMEFCAVHSGGMYGGSESNELVIYKNSGECKKLTIPKEDGAHGGADIKMLDVILNGRDSDPLSQSADTRDGTLAASIGMAANVSMKENRRVGISELMIYEGM